MLFRLSALSVLVPFVSALTLSTPTNWTSGGAVTFTWTTSAGDNSVFSLELSNPIIFNQALALANNVDVTLQTISFTLPIVPATTGYTLEAVNVTNINDIFAQSGSFSVGATVSSSAISSSSASVSVSGSGSTGVVTISPASSTPFGSTVKASSTPTTPASASGSGASSASSPAPSSFNGNGALSNLNLGYGSWAVMGLGAVFGVMATL